MSRPAFDELLAYARTGDVLVVTELSRLGRKMRGVIELVDDLAARGIGVRPLARGIDTCAGPAAKVILAGVAALGEVERDILVERTRSGLAAARVRGRVGDRPVVVTPEQLAAARTLIADGRSAVSVARTLGFARSSLYRAMERDRLAAPVAWADTSSPQSPTAGGRLDRHRLRRFPRG